MATKETAERLERGIAQGLTFLIAHRDGRFLQRGSRIDSPAWGGLDGAETFDGYMAHANSQMLWPEVGFFPKTVSVRHALNTEQTNQTT